MNTVPLPPPYLRRQIAAREEADPLSPLDPVTRVWSRSSILQVCARILQAAAGQSRPVGVALLAIDPFGEVRASHGQAVSDAVLHESAVRVRRELGAACALGRFSRDQFLLVLPDCPQAVIAATAERIRHAIIGAPFFLGGPIDVTMNLGATLATGGSPDIHAILGAAEDALDCAKYAGYNRIEMMWPTASQRLFKLS